MSPTPLVIAKNQQKEIVLRPGMANRHGLITGATGTGKTVTLQVMAERLSSIGVPVFLADVKGDLSGISRAGQSSEKLEKRLASFGLPVPEFSACPAIFWDVFGKAGHHLRATVSDLGHLLLSRILMLNETQQGVLALVFKAADDQGLLLLDIKDLRAMLQYVGENSKDFAAQYGNVSPASIGAIQRGLLRLEQEGGGYFLGEPMMDIDDLLLTDRDQGVIHILAADRLLNTPMLYSTVLLWLLAELFERLPEVGDMEKPRLAFFFDEAHLLFNDAPRVLLQRIEQVVRLIRSKGVGIYFVTQNPTDIPDTILGQLGNRVNHALRAFTEKDRKAVRAAARTMRANPKIDTETAITELGVGEALISLLEENGNPGIVERAFIMPPASRIGPITPEERLRARENSPLNGVYDEPVDRDSAYEMLARRMQQPVRASEAAPSKQAARQTPGGSARSGGKVNDIVFGTSRRQGVLEAAAKTAARSAATSATNQVMKSIGVKGVGKSVAGSLVRGILGSLLGRR
ncbi:MAG: DUF853 domain-containing protein [Acidobacteriota bacterium]|jgi:DNA helicase HerA-like ATPase|nr:DUF853 domain-containing protein [Acidobacteriota bacterium]